ncbi:DUF5313 domain-containing protein [Tsukamurella sp. 8F]|uniref:DUF5313 domain-containing protein n=1 Tax=unclassified Tsukamurella TaxID=2633480 RepID=UPI0023B8C542|nr:MULTISPECIES: DUF5313 domain-containing protein [unclassified Tsukamurella]MDF0530433.1 DUF5313 domain-containing protein [Tsukamurella sp. 8J]MDF0587746.1 DUF5313 domain-containing protein [Tsukamurella sp. 8F]
MSDAQRRTKPNPLQYVAYSYGYTLPPEMNDWVRNDLAGRGAALRTVVRASIPCVLMLVPFLFIPTTLYVHMSMTLPILIPFVYFAIALNKIYRRSRLKRHGLDPDLVDERARIRDAAMHAEYAAKHGRPLPRDGR